MILRPFASVHVPERLDLFNVSNAVLYVLCMGAQWRQLPYDFPKWQTVYNYFAMWSKSLANSEDFLIDLLLKKLSLENDYAWDDQYERHS